MVGLGELFSIIIVRVVSIFLVQTQFAPDEYYQSMEIAHNHVFGYGVKTWEWDRGLRGYLYPSIFILIYRILQFTGLDSHSSFLFIIPRVFHAFSQVVCDVYTLKIGSKLFNNNRMISRIIFVFLLSNWFNFYCGVRTYSNSLETTVTTIAIFSYLSSPHSIRWLMIAGFGCCMRPTNALCYIPIFFYHLAVQPSMTNRLRFMLYCLLAGFFWISAGLLIDRLFYGEWVFVMYNFAKFNLLEGQSALYGTHPFHWYFSQGIPVILGFVRLIFVVISLWIVFVRGRGKGMVNLSKHYLLLLIILFVTLFYSKLPHKEFRFVFPILPLLIIYASYGFYKIPDGGTKRLLFMFSMMLNLVAMVYFCLIHQRGGLDVMKYLQSSISTKFDEDHTIKVQFLIPCHHTPGYAFIHHPNPNRYELRFLDCSPIFEEEGEENPTTMTQQDAFYQDPRSWCEENVFSGVVEKPDVVILYGKMGTFLEELLGNEGYEKEREFFHMFFPDVFDGRMDETFVLYSLVK